MSNFAKRHYLALAEALHKAKPLIGGKPAQAWLNSCLSISNTLAEDNPNFQPERFLLACNEGIHAKYVRADVAGGPAMEYGFPTRDYFRWSQTGRTRR
jgi:hypothetical protein